MESFSSVLIMTRLFAYVRLMRPCRALVLLP